MPPTPHNDLHPTARDHTQKEGREERIKLNLAGRVFVDPSRNADAAKPPRGSSVLAISFAPQLFVRSNTSDEAKGTALFLAPPRASSPSPLRRS
jgi:hypothetical protein